MMPEMFAIFDRQLDFDRTADFETFARQAPAKWAVYLMSDADDRPVQLLCVKNLRYSLKRRLGTEEAVGVGGISKRVNYRELVRRIRWRRVDSTFEADWIYYEAARQVFPESYRGMVGFRPAWFVHVDPRAQFPRYVKTIDLSETSGEFIGPLEDKHAAARLIELIEDAFDLCRYHHILTQSPTAKPCAYKEMKKCPAPCDGSISLEQYRRLVELSVSTLMEPAEAVREHTRRMQQAAGELRFELAAKIKSYVDQLSQLGKGAYRHAGRLKDFNFLVLQHGPRPQRGEAKAFLITPGRIDPLLCLLEEPARPAEILRAALTLADDRPVGQLDAAGIERIGVVTHHLFSSKQTHGVFLRMDCIDEKAIAKACRELRKQTAPLEEAEGEGVMKELQSM